MSHEASFFDTHSPAPVIKQRKRRRWFWPIFLAIFIILAVWVVYILVAAGKVVSSSLDGRDALLEARDAAVALDFERSKDELEKAETYFAQADDDFRLLRPIRSLPWVDDQIDAAEAMVLSGRSVAAALIDCEKVLKSKRPSTTRKIFLETWKVRGLMIKNNVLVQDISEVFSLSKVSTSARITGKVGCRKLEIDSLAKLLDALPEEFIQTG